MTLHEFEKSIQYGEIGERRVKERLVSQGYEVYDKSDDYKFRKKGTDLLVRINGVGYLVEVKCDEVVERTENIFYETKEMYSICRNGQISTMMPN